MHSISRLTTDTSYFIVYFTFSQAQNDYMVCEVFKTFKAARNYVLESIEMEAESQAEMAAELAMTNYYENRGYDDAREQEAVEEARGVYW